jgi:hypothetical protein
MPWEMGRRAWWAPDPCLADTNGSNGYQGREPAHQEAQVRRHGFPDVANDRLGCCCTAASPGRLTGPQDCEAAPHAWWRRASYVLSSRPVMCSHRAYARSLLNHHSDPRTNSCCTPRSPFVPSDPTFHGSNTRQPRPTRTPEVSIVGGIAGRPPGVTFGSASIPDAGAVRPYAETRRPTSSGAGPRPSLSGIEANDDWLDASACIRNLSCGSWRRPR